MVKCQARELSRSAPQLLVLSQELFLPCSCSVPLWSDSVEPCWHSFVGLDPPHALWKAIRNVDRSVGGILSFEITRRYGQRGLPDDTILVKFQAGHWPCVPAII